jgi:hypothetical protein
MYYPAGSVPLPSHLTSCTPTKSGLYLDSSLKTVIREPTLYKVLTFLNPLRSSKNHYSGSLLCKSHNMFRSLLTITRHVWIKTISIVCLYWITWLLIIFADTNTPIFNRILIHTPHSNTTLNQPPFSNSSSHPHCIPQPIPQLSPYNM